MVFSPNSEQADGATASNRKIRNAIKKVTSEFELIKEVINSMKEAIAIGEGGNEETNEEEVNNVIENLENKLEEISDQVYKIVDEAQAHLTQRIEFPEDESLYPQKDDIASVTTRTSSTSQQQNKRQEADDTILRLKQLEKEQHNQEEDLEKQLATLVLAKQHKEGHEELYS